MNYIELCTNRRANPENEFERQFWKILVKSVFEKCMENIRKTITIQSVSKRYQKEPKGSKR